VSKIFFFLIINKVTLFIRRAGERMFSLTGTINCALYILQWALNVTYFKFTIQQIYCC